MPALFVPENHPPKGDDIFRTTQPGWRRHSSSNAADRLPAREQLAEGNGLCLPRAARLVLLRHGQSEWKARNLFTGWANTDLTEAGSGTPCAPGGCSAHTACCRTSSTPRFSGAPSAARTWPWQPATGTGSRWSAPGG